jgi:hypothetical protein
LTLPPFKIQGDLDQYFPCAKCSKLTHIDDLDGKPEPRFNWFFYRSLWLWWTGRSHAAFDDPEGNTDWERLECRECYGPGYSSNRRAA